MEFLLDLDREILLALNGAHVPWLDEVMFWVSNKYVWIPVYAVLLWVMVRHLGWRSALVAGALVGLLILLSDQLTSGLLKPWVARLRPCHDPEIAAMVHRVHNKCGGQFGFASSHAANFFALATYLAGVFADRSRYWRVGFLVVAGLVALSRIYLGVHFPGDVIVGALIGVGAGRLVYGVYRWLEPRLTARFGP
ncbi:MAG: phosphatase PAP2 family protein [Bacteroidota bacterium]